MSRKLTIPLPGRGYWARKQAGQKLSQDPLPEIQEKDKALLQKPAPPTKHPTTEELWADDERAQIAGLERD